MASARFPLSDHCDGRIFFNPGHPAEHGLGDLLKWKFTGRPIPWPKQVALPPGVPAARGPDQIAVTWLGHSTFLLATPAGNFLTDPVLRDRIGPVRWAGPRRVVPAALTAAQLPRIDTILLSHDHFDHCDLPTLRRLRRDWAPTVVSPLGYASFLGHGGAAAAVTEMDWWQSRDLGEGVTVTLLPARHWCRRRPGATNVRLWGGFMLTVAGRRLCFVGDSGYDETLFKEIGRRTGAPDLALVPIGAYEPRWFMRGAHANPAEAVRIHLDLGAKRSVAMHWGTFRLTDEGREQPPIDLAQARRDAGLASADFIVLDPGASVLL
jgi:L-ascorbate metabolism protein UlaG (beta-lactamase superfamily)